MINNIILSIALALVLPFFAVFANEDTNPNMEPLAGNYTIIVEGHDWGPAVSKVILTMEETVSEANAANFTVAVERSSEGVEMSAVESKGIRKVVHAYVSDAKGKRVPEGNHIALVLFVSPDEVLGSPIKYIRVNNRGSNQWIDYNMSIKDTSSNKIWNTEAGRIMPGIDKFDLSGTYSQNGTTLTYGSFAPQNNNGKSPLIIWLHGGGEGGTDPSIALIANKATNYASDEIQSIFGGAHVLVPQTPTFWMQNANGEYTRGDKNDIYNEALMGLIKKYVADNPGIDENRIYVGGCSNGGYMSLKLMLLQPDYFAAAYISALAYWNQYITDEQVQSIKHIPIWFVHSKDDPVTIPDETVVPLYKRLIDVGAKDVHFSYYDHVIDLSGFFGGDDYHYNGHWSWIYSHSNHADFDFDGKPVMQNDRPVTIMEWMAAQEN
ncbi:MAG: prolyl oligopeptidase family serine peptidase [Aurantibacter sp.]